MMNRLLRAIPSLCLAALASCAYFDPVNPPDPLPVDKSITWSTKLGNGVKNVGRCVLETSDGGLAFVGTIELSWAKGDELWLVKTASPTAEQWGVAWSATFGGADADTGSFLRATSDGGYILLGSTRSMGAGGWDVYLVKTDAIGSKQWEKTFGGTADDRGWSVECIAEGYIIVGSTGSFGDNSGDAYLISVDKLGNSVWEKAFGGPNTDVGYAVRQAADGGFVIAGCKQPLVSGDDTAWMLKTDADGELAWEKTFGTIATSTEEILLEQAKDVQLTADGGYVLAGHNHPAVGDFDGWLIKTDDEGNMEWDRTIGGENWDQAEAVVLTADGGYALAGMSRSYGPWNQAWLVKTDAAGNQEWEKHFGGADDEWAYGLKQTGDEANVLIATCSGNGQQAYLVYYKPWSEVP